MKDKINMKYFIFQLISSIVFFAIVIFAIPYFSTTGIMRLVLSFIVILVYFIIDRVIHRFYKKELRGSKNKWCDETFLFINIMGDNLKIRIDHLKGKISYQHFLLWASVTMQKRYLMKEINVFIREDKDVNLWNVVESVHAVATVPGGVGTVTTVLLLNHTIIGAERL